jgi:hypothetical protein
MSLIFDISLAIPIGILYNILIHKLGEIINDNLEYNIKIQRNLILVFIGGIIGLIVAHYVFVKQIRFKNRSISYGLYFGSALLLFHTLFYNWNVLANDTKLFIIIFALVFLIIYAYSNNTDDKLIEDE